MRSAIFLIATALLALLSPGFGLTIPNTTGTISPPFSSSASRHSFARTLERRLQEDFGFSGSTPEQVCNSILENWYFDGYPEKYFTSCTCEPKPMGGYSVSCSDYCEHCLPGACSRFMSTMELNDQLLVETLVGCDDFNATSFNGIEVCYREDYTTNPATLEYFIDDQKCASAEFVDCPLFMDGMENVGFPLPRVDCSNLGYGMDMNFCAEGTITTGPFGFLSDLWFSLDEFTLGTCSPPQCQSQLDASDLCIETELLGDRGNECRSCTLQAFEAINGINPSSCTEGETVACALINQCDNECFPCEDKGKEFVKCYFPNVPGGPGCSVDCFTSSGAMPKALMSNIAALAMTWVVIGAYFM